MAWRMNQTRWPSMPARTSLQAPACMLNLRKEPELRRNGRSPAALRILLWPQHVVSQGRSGCGAGTQAAIPDSWSRTGSVVFRAYRGRGSCHRGPLGAETGVYNVVDDNPLPVSSWLPQFAQWVNAPPPLQITEEVALKAGGEDAVYYETSAWCFQPESKATPSLSATTYRVVENGMRGEHIK